MKPLSARECMIASRYAGATSAELIAELERRGLFVFSAYPDSDFNPATFCPEGAKMCLSSAFDDSLNVLCAEPIDMDELCEVRIYADHREIANDYVILAVEDCIEFPYKEAVQHLNEFKQNFPDKEGYVTNA